MKTFIVDAFTDRPFRGNPAGVCIATATLTCKFQLQIAQELGLSETAFVTGVGAGSYRIRYFSPKMEIPLCGHATLAAAKVLFEINDFDALSFTTGEGLVLDVIRQGDAYAMELPAYTTEPSDAPQGLLTALGLGQIQNSAFNSETRILLLEIESADILAALQPDFAALIRSHDGINGVLVTAQSPNDDFDFHSRYFWPWSGTNEDPVTGATHTFLAPYWSTRLGKTKLRSFQSSPRTGSMQVEVLGSERVQIRGSAVIVLRGDLAVNPEMAE